PLGYWADESIASPTRRDKALLLKKNLHRLKVKGDRIGSEEIVANHAGQAEAKHVLPRERAVVETRDVVFLQVSEGKPTHSVRHNFQFPAPAGPFESLAFLQFYPCLFDNR